MMPDPVILKVQPVQHQNEVGYGKARLDNKTRKDLGLEVGDIVEIRGKGMTVAKVLKSSQEDENKGIIRIDGMLRAAANVSIGDKVSVCRAEYLPAAKLVLMPRTAQGKVPQFSPGVEDLLRKGLMGRPFVKGDETNSPNVGLMGGYMSMKVVSTTPSGIVVVGEQTEIVLRTEPSDEVVEDTTTYDDVGGLGDELQRVREMVELPMKHPELFDHLGIGAPRGVLLYGPPGTGKTLLAKALANESGASFFTIQGPEIISKYYGQSEEKLREKFKEAEKHGPSIIFIDEVDSIAPKREEAGGEAERRVVAQLLTLMDGINERGRMIVIAATNREDSIDPALRRPGRFDREIEIGVPSLEGRKEILEIHTRGMPLESGFDLDRFAAITHGYVGADLAALVREAAMKALRRIMPDMELDKPIPGDMLMRLRVTERDFIDALREMEPSSLREVLVDIPKVRWEDVGGLEDVKRQLREVVEMPIERPEAFKRMGIRAARGVLLYGPPGTGKTLLAKAVANESKANFISIKGPEIMSKWQGESERAVREAFKKAKQASPCVVFLDEIDAIAPRRGMGDSGATERVVNQLLTSIDGIEELDGVVVIAATNRPDIIDPALLRPGRFDRLVLVPMPDADARRGILNVHTRSMPLEGVDLESLVPRTEGFVGADLENLCREAAMAALREDKDAASVLTRHFEEALRTVRPSLDKDVIRHYESIARSLAKSSIGWVDPGMYR
jgi:transitional endoplasmic reticulum ATPase